MLEETPVDGPALRKALLRLYARAGWWASGWIGLTNGPRRSVDFFGRPSRLPTGYIRLALSSQHAHPPSGLPLVSEAPLYVITAPLIEMERTVDSAADVPHNAHRVLAVMERWIRRETPDQWLMYHRVWPADGA